jgi:hypothetical protein
MAIREMVDGFLDAVNTNANMLAHNSDLFDVYEGQLLDKILEDLKRDMSEKSYAEIKTRIAPINVLVRIVDKLSKIYMQSPLRRVEGGNDKDKELLAWFVKEFKMDWKMNNANEFFNLFKNTLLQPLLDESTGKPFLRIIPSDRFIPFSTNKIDPTKPTHILTLEGKAKSISGNSDVMVFGAYSATEWIMFDSDRVIRTDMMGSNPEGMNPYGALPFVYVNRSANLLVPKRDTDTLTMTKLIPIILSDLNYAAKFQCFSIIYGLNCDDQNIVMSPNAFWTFNSSDPEKKPEIGVIKPSVDIPQVISLIQSQLSFWLQSRGIRPGSIGQLTSENAASGISKIVDEMDTSEDRQKQVNWFQQAEADLWDLVLKKMHPVWVRTGLTEQRYIFTPTAEVEVDFPEQLPLIDRTALVTTMKEEVASGFTTKKRAIAKLNPGMDDESIEELMMEIEAERGGAVEMEISPGLSDRQGGERGSDGSEDSEDLGSDAEPTT